MDASASPTIDANLNRVYGFFLQIESASFPSTIKNKNTVIKYTKLPAFDVDSQGLGCTFPRIRRLVTLDDSPVKTSRSLKSEAPQRMESASITKRKIVTIEEDDEIKLYPKFARDRRKEKASETQSNNEISHLSTSRLSNSLNLKEKKKISNLRSTTRVAEVQVKSDDNSQKAVSRLINHAKYYKESKTSAKNINTTSNRKDLNSPKLNYKSRYSNNSQQPVEVSKTRPIKEPVKSVRSGKMPSKISLNKNQDPSRESEKESLVNKHKFKDNEKLNTSSKKSVDRLQLSKLAKLSESQQAAFLKEISKRKPVTVIQVPLDVQCRKENIIENEAQISLNAPSPRELESKIDCTTETEKKSLINSDISKGIGTTVLVSTTDQETQMEKETQFLKEDLCECVESRHIQTDYTNQIFDSLAVPNVTLTKDKSSTKEEILNFHSKSLPNLHVPSLKIAQYNNEESQNSNIRKGSYFIGHATVTCTTRQKINFHVVGNSSETLSNQPPSPLAYPINVVSIFEKEMKRQKQHDNSFNQQEPNVQCTNCLNELQSLNCSYVLSNDKLVKPSDIISTIKINHGLLQNEFIYEQFQSELNFIDSFFESLQYLESCSLTNSCISEKKVESLVNNPDFDVNHSEYGSFISKLENGANVDDSETMASKSLCLLNLLIRDEQRRAKNLLFVLKMREDALKDFTKSQILWLENKKRQENTDISTLKKKQRGALLKLQHECGEMQRMRKALLTQSEKRKLALMKTKKNIELKLKNNVDVDQIILEKKKLKRNVIDRNTTPLKCFDLSSSGCEESSPSRPKVETKLPETRQESDVVSVTSAEKCIQTGESKLQTAQMEQSTDTAAENFVVVDGGYLNILFHNLSLPEIFSTSKQYEVNEKALRNIVSSTTTNHSFNETDLEKFVNQIKNTDMESSSPSTARSLVEELDQYYKGLVEDKLPEQSPVDDAHSIDAVDLSVESTLQPSSFHNLSTIMSGSSVASANNASLLKEERQCVNELSNVADVSEKEVVMSATPTGPLPVPVGAAAGADTQAVDPTLWGNVESSSSSGSELFSASSQPHSPSRTSISSQCEAEELRRQQLAIEREIKALEQQQSQLLVVREIPDKPPPPYTPPAEARGARQPRKYVADETTEEKIQKYMRDPHTDSCDPTDAFDTFVKDFCIETLDKHTLERTDKPWDACNLLPQKPPEDTEKLIKKTSSNLLEILTGVGPVIVSGVGARRSDHIDDVLFAEWRRCEPEWTTLQSDEALVKNQIFEGIFQKILTETIDEYKRTVMCDQ